MGLTSWENALDGKIVKTDVSVANGLICQGSPKLAVPASSV